MGTRKIIILLYMQNSKSFAVQVEDSTLCQLNKFNWVYTD